MLGAVISGALTALTMPGFFLGFIVWISLIPFFQSLRNAGPLSAFFKGFLYGYTLIGISLFWLFPTLSKNVPFVLRTFPSWMGGLVFFLLCAVEAFFFGMTGLFYSFMNRLRRRSSFHSAIIFASSYALFEYLRSVGDLGFTGGRLSDALHWNTGYILTLSVWGTLGLTWLVAFTNAMIALWFENIRRRRMWKLLLVVCALNGVGMIIASFLPPQVLDDGRLKVYAVQTNVPQSVKYSRNPLSSLKTVEKFLMEAPEDVDVVVFPEATFMMDVKHHYLGSLLIAKVRESGLPVILGFPLKLEGRSFNHVELIDPSTGFTGEGYSKRRLSPFAEFLPYPRIFRIFRFLKFLEYFESGKDSTPVNLNDANVGIMICFESYFTEIAREVVKEGADLLITVTNDGWFESKIALKQHFVQSGFRAVEYGRYILQVANTGITGLWDKYGRPVNIIRPNIEDAYTLTIPCSRGKTVYYYLGRYIPVALVLVLLLFLII